MRKKYLIVAFTFLLFFVIQNSFGQIIGGDYGDGPYLNPCDHTSDNYDPYDPTCDTNNDVCDPMSTAYAPELCTGGSGGSNGGGGGGGGGGGSSSGGTNSSAKPLTKQDFDKLVNDNKATYNISVKTNQVIKTSDGVTHIGTLTKFKNDQGYIFYYFTPNATDDRFQLGMYYRIPDSQGSTAIFGNTGSTGNIGSSAVSPTYYSYDFYDFPFGQGYYYTSQYGGEVSINILPNNNTETVLNTCTTCNQNSPDPDATSVGGASASDARQLQESIMNVLDKSPKFNKFKALIKRGPRNNKDFFSKIPLDKLNEALNDLNEGDQKIFATIVANTINSNKSMTIHYFSTETLLKKSSGEVITSYSKVVNAFKLNPILESTLLASGDGLTSKELLNMYSGGATAKLYGTIISALDTTSPKYDEVTALHEFFGHGRPLSIETSTYQHDEKDAILFENMVWRLLGQPGKQRNGFDHGKQPRQIVPNHTTAFPTFR